MPRLTTTLVTADKHDIDALQTLEQQCFQTDRLSRRSMSRFIKHQQCVFLIAKQNDDYCGYVLIIFHRGTRLSRLYSLAVTPQKQGQGIAKQLLLAGEQAAMEKGAFHIRLEVNHSNQEAIRLYDKLGYKTFGLLQDYYEDHSDALRMQKRIRFHDKSAVHTVIPWFQQNTDFTCGPASLMMALAGLNKNYQHSLSEELQLWREATTIFMTSGHGGCHPLGLALAAVKRGFKAQVWLNQTTPLFVDGVRNEEKKTIISHVHHDFTQQCQDAGISIHYDNINQTQLINLCDQGAVPLLLISTYRMDQKKAPHWVAVSGYDDQCFYVHDPDPDEKQQDLIDCQYMPIAYDDFDSMSSFGTQRLRTAVILSV